MKSLRNNRRILGAVLLTVLCLAVTATPAAASDAVEASLDERVGRSGFSRVIDYFDSSLSSFIKKLGAFWSATGARIDD